MLYFLSGVLLFMASVAMFVMGLVFVNYDFSIFMDWVFFSVNSCDFVLTLFFDYMSIFFMSVVLMISSMVVFYSYKYMIFDYNMSRFLFLVLLFILSMMFMILSPNLVSILLGWDGLGLISYALVVYFGNYNSSNAGMFTIMINRLGDAGILMAIAWLFNYGGWHFLFYLNVWDCNMFVVLCMITLACFTKSAQIPFSSWLPLAMAAPTPVSALVHSSTLVTAGVYMLIRFNYLFMNFSNLLLVYLGLITMFMAGLLANFEYDLSKIIALSTLSQLGLMVSVLFLGHPLLSFFHLLVHAFFKALLFLCAGMIIHIMNNNQDLRMMGGVFNSMPWSYTCFLISTFSLCGLPFLSGFYSKDLIIESVCFSSFNFFVLMIYYLSLCLTVCYSLRLIYYSLINYNIYCCQFYSEDIFMLFPMILMLFMSVVEGSSLMWILFSFYDFFFLSFDFKVLPLIITLLSFYLIFKLCIWDFLSPFYLGWFLGSSWFLTNLSVKILGNFGFYVSLNFYSVLDGGWGEYLVSRSIFSFFVKLSIDYIYFYKSSIKFLLISFLVSCLFFLL